MRRLSAPGALVLLCLLGTAAATWGGEWTLPQEERLLAPVDAGKEGDLHEGTPLPWTTTRGDEIHLDGRIAGLFSSYPGDGQRILGRYIAEACPLSSIKGETFALTLERRGDGTPLYRIGLVEEGRFALYLVTEELYRALAPRWKIPQIPAGDPSVNNGA